MEDNKFLIVLVVAVVGFLALPLVLNAVKGGGAALTPAGAKATPSPMAGATPPGPPPGTPPGAQPPPGAAAPAPVPTAAAPGLTAASLTGTAWEAGTQYGVIQIQLNPGGQLAATHPMIGAIPGTWNVAGNKVNATATAMGQTLNIGCEIQGTNLIYQGKPLKRLR